MSIITHAVKCSRCHCKKPIADFIGKRRRFVKTCVRCRESYKNVKRDKAVLAEYARAFRKKNPHYRSAERRKANNKRYYEKKKAIIKCRKRLTPQGQAAPPSPRLVE
jgi:hypothetical protein